MSINWEKLSWLSKAPREFNEADAAKYNEIYSKPFWFVFWGGGKKGWMKDMAEGYLLRTGVIQANEILFDKEEAEVAPAVICWFKDPSLNTSNDAIETLLRRISTEQDKENYDPNCGAFMNLLDDEESSFTNVQIPLSLTDGKEAYVSTTHLNPENLPNGCIPENRILPGFYMHREKYAEIISPKLYS